MTRKHFEALARALRTNRPDDPAMLAQWRADVRMVAGVCYAANGRFDRERFYRVAGMG